MKYFFAVCLVLLIAGCAKNTKLEFNGTTPGINKGTFTLKDINDSLICYANINAGKFAVTEQINGAGYGYLSINTPGMGAVTFDVYIEPGKYTVTTNSDKPYKYPDIQSSSKTQNDLTAYYQLFDKVKDQLQKNVADLNARLNDPKIKSSPNIYNDLEAKLQTAQQQQLDQGIIALSSYVNQYPDNTITLRLMYLNNAYISNPKAYYKIYKRLNTDIRNSRTGQSLGKLLDSLSRTQ